MHARHDPRFTPSHREEVIAQRIENLGASQEYKALRQWAREGCRERFSDYLYARIAREVDSDITDAMEAAA